MIKETREAIKNLLASGFLESGGKTPYITIKGFPESKEALEAMQKEAKSYDECAIAVTFTAEHPGVKQAAIYPKFVDIYTIYIFSNAKDSDEEIIEYYEITRNILQTKYYLYLGEMSPVKSEKSGLYMAAIQVGTQNIYQGV
jgi:hypothetical protein